MSSMWVGVEGAGYGGFSGGQLHLVTECFNHFYYYKTACQGTSWSNFVAEDFFPVTDDLVARPGIRSLDSLLMCLNGMVVKLEIPDVFAFRGRVEFTFEVYPPSQTGPDPIFKCRRFFEARGFASGAVKVTTRIPRPPEAMGRERARALIGALGMALP